MGETWMVAAHAWDLGGARREGFATAWVAREEKRWLDVLPRPDLQGDALRAGEPGEDLVVDPGVVVEPLVHVDPDEGALHVGEGEHDELAPRLHLGERGRPGEADAEGEKDRQGQKQDAAAKRKSHIAPPEGCPLYTSTVAQLLPRVIT